MKDKIEYLLKHNEVIQSLYKTVMGGFFRVLGRFIKVDEKLVLLSSFSGKRFDDSPRCIYEAMRSRAEFEGFKFVWALNDPDNISVSGADKIKMDSPAYFATALRAKYWITNVNIERGLRFKQPETVYLNTWHGTPIKTIGNAVDGRTDYDFSYVDIITSDGPFFTETMIRDFGALRKSIVECGRPCDDALFEARGKDAGPYKARLGIEASKTVILYAPTWREAEGGGSSFDFEPPIDISKWRRFLGDDKVLLFRAHSSMGKVLGIEFDDQIVDVTSYPDINDLILAADYLISDYSGTYFDFAITGKPMFCFGYDFDEYSKKRGFYFDVRDYLTSFADQDSMLDYLSSFNYSDESKKTNRFFQKFAGAGGNAIQTSIDALLEKGR